jgi:hypothetical protein
MNRTVTKKMHTRHLLLLLSFVFFSFFSIQLQISNITRATQPTHTTAMLFYCAFFLSFSHTSRQSANNTKGKKRTEEKKDKRTI